MLPIPVLLLLAAAAAPAASAAERIELDNGLTVLLSPRPGAPVVAAAAYVRVGRVDEPERLAGATHFVEHMLFRATRRRPEGGSEREAWATGARMEAHTNSDYTRFRLVLPADRLDVALDVLSDALSGALFLPDEVEEERRVVREEIRKRAADPETRAFEDGTGLLFLPHPYGARIAGTLESVSRIGRDDLYGWYRARYRPDRTVLVLVGSFDPDAATAAIRRDFGEWTGAGDPPPPAPPLPRSPRTYQESIVRAPGASPILLLQAPMPGLLDPDYLPARFLKETLSGWVRDRLVGPDGPALATDVWFSPVLPAGMLRIRLTLARPGDAARARDGLLGLLAELRSGELPIHGLPELASWFAAQEVLTKEDPGPFADVIGRAALAGYYDPAGRPATLVAPDRYTGIGPEDLRRVARRYLSPGNLALLFLLPDGAASPVLPVAEDVAGPGAGFAAPAAVARVPAPPDERPDLRPASPRDDRDAVVTEIPGGPTLAILEDDSLPLVGGAIVFPSGSRDDPPGKEGTALLAARAIPRGTTGYEETDLRWRLFAAGNDYTFRAGRDATIVSFTVPRERFEETVRTLAVMLAAPSFSDPAVREARGLVARDQRTAADRIATFAGEAFRAGLLAGGGYGHEPHGTPESLARIGRDDLVAWHRAHLRPGRAFVCLVGDLTPRRARGIVEEAFGRSEGPPPGPRPRAAPPAPVPAAVRSLPHPSGRAYLIAGAAVPGLDAPEAPALSLLQQVLGWRAYQEFTNDRSTAYEAGAFLDAFAEGGVFGLYVGTAPGERGSAESWLRAALARARTEAPEPELLEDARRAWLGSAALSSVRAAAVAARIAWRGAVGLGPHSFPALVEGVREVTGAALRKAAARWLPEDGVSVLRVGPPGSGLPK